MEKKEKKNMPIRQLEHTYILTVTMPTAGLAANNVTSVQWQMNPQVAAIPFLNVPAAESWLLEDLYVTAAQTYDGILQFYKNMTQIAFNSGNINGLVVTNVARPIPTPFLYQGNDIMTAFFINTGVVPSSGTAYVVTVYAKFRRFTPY